MTPENPTSILSFPGMGHEIKKSHLIQFEKWPTCTAFSSSLLKYGNLTMGKSIFDNLWNSDAG